MPQIFLNHFALKGTTTTAASPQPLDEAAVVVLHVEP
jgi:hypothetical protein